MKRYFIGCLTLFVCLLLGSSICFAQQLITGIPPFSTTTGGSFDAIDLANLNVHFSIPIFSRPGKGIPFNYSLTYNSLIWYPVTSGGTTSWQPVTNRGWAAQGTGLSEWFSYPQTTVNCYDNLGHQSGAVVTLGPYTYYEPSGTPHLINNTLVQISGSNCSGNPRSQFTTSASDGSGFVANISFSGPNTVTTSSGKVLYPSTSNSNPANGVVAADANGNQISYSNGVFTDTLGTTALTVSGPTPNNPLQCSPAVTYKYTAPNGQQATITVSYVGYIIQTNFNVPGIQEYGPANACLVQTITLPDGSAYGFAYEGTAGHSGELTGRLLSVTLPTGGSISWSYTNSSCYNASNCMMADGSPAWMVRTYGGNSWNYQRYVRSAQGWCGSSSLQTDTTIVDPNDNYTDYYFSGLYPTASSVYVGARTRFLDTKRYCYNGNTTNCACVLVAPTETTPITNSIVADYPNSNIGTAYSEIDSTYDSYGNLTRQTERDYGTAAYNSNTVLRQTIIALSSSLCTNYNICNAPASVQISNGSTQAASTTYSYDQDGHTHGNVTTIARSPLTGSNPNLNQTFPTTPAGRWRPPPTPTARRPRIPTIREGVMGRFRQA